MEYEAGIHNLTIWCESLDDINNVFRLPRRRENRMLHDILPRVTRESDGRYKIECCLHRGVLPVLIDDIRAYNLY